MKYTFSFLVLLLVTIPAHPEGVQHSDPELHFSIELPKDWRRLPQDVADRAARAFSNQTGKPLPKYRAWFQQSNKPDGAYPYLLIDCQICQMPTLDTLADGIRKIQSLIAEEHTNKLRGVISDARLFDPVIDTRRSMVFIESEQTVKISDAGKIKSKTCVFPGRIGVVQLHFHSNADEADRSKVDFDFIIDSFAFEPNFDYQSGLVPDTPKRDFDFSRLLMYGLSGGLLGPLLYRLLKARNPKSPPRRLHLRVLFAMLIVLGGLDFLIIPSSGPNRVNFGLGCLVLGVIGLSVSLVIEMKSPPSLPKEGSNGLSPPT